MFISSPYTTPHNILYRRRRKKVHIYIHIHIYVCELIYESDVACDRVIMQNWSLYGFCCVVLLYNNKKKTATSSQLRHILMQTSFATSAKKKSIAYFTIEKNSRNKDEKKKFDLEGMNATRRARNRVYEIYLLSFTRFCFH